MLHTGKEREKKEHDLAVGVVSNQDKCIYIAHFSQKEIRCGAERERGDEQRDVRTSGALLSRKRD